MTDVLRRVGTESIVSLREVTESTVREICKLKVSKDQENFVAPNAVSIAQAYFSKNAWFRAIYADDIPVGFLMLYDDPEKAEYFLWRLMIAEEYQGLGFGKRAVELLIEHVRTRPKAKILEVSCVEGEGSPKRFYEKLGFKLNGKTYGGEIGLELEL